MTISFEYGGTILQTIILLLIDRKKYRKGKMKRTQEGNEKDRKLITYIQQKGKIA